MRSAVDIVVTIVSLSLVTLNLAQSQQITHGVRTSRSCSVLHLLNVQPFPDPQGGFDGGLNLIPAAALAAEEINSRPDILEGFQLKIVNIGSEGCGRSMITKGLINFYRELVTHDQYHNSSECLVGAVGFPCSSATNVLAPVIGHRDIGYVTLANSATPAHRNISQYPNLFHTISSSSVHNKVLVSLMQRFNWRRIGVIYDSLNVFFRTTANDFIQRVNSLPSSELTVSVPITVSPLVVRDAFNIINIEEARITYWQGRDNQNALCLCEAYRRHFLYPGYVYILRYNPNIVANLLNALTSCSREEMMQAMEGVFMLDYRLHVEDDTALFSGWKYREFRQRYADKLEEYAKITNQSLQTNIYGNSFYDQIWAFALALNYSLPSMRARNLSFSDYTFGNTAPISSIIKQELNKLSFQGASGRIEFDENHEIPSFVDLFQIQGGMVKQIATYNPFTKNATFNENFRNDIPSDTFDTVYSLLPFWLGVCIFVIQGVLFCIITTNVILLLWWRNESEVKATSLLLSLLLCVGCYLLCLGPTIRILYRVILIQSTTIHTFLCSLNLWSTTLGLDLVISALLFRLFRIVHVFRSFQKKSKFLSDEYLVVYSLLACSVKVILLIVWSVVDLYRSNSENTYVPTVNPPKYRVLLSCACNQLGIWLAVSYLYTYILLLLVLFLAIQTRRIKKTLFKDTKKVNLFVFLTIITLTTTITLWVLFSEVGIESGADISEWAGIFIVTINCQLCLIIPKLLPIAIKKDKTRRGHKLARDYTVASEFEWIRRKSRSSISILIA